MDVGSPGRRQAQPVGLAARLLDHCRSRFIHGISKQIRYRLTAPADCRRIYPGMPMLGRGAKPMQIIQIKHKWYVWLPSKEPCLGNRRLNGAFDTEAEATAAADEIKAKRAEYQARTDGGH